MRAVLIAAKQLNLAKTRLAPGMEPAERQALAEAMFRDVLGASLAARRPAHIAVVSSDQKLLGIARTVGVMAIDEQFPRGLNAAVGLATGVLSEQGVSSLAVVLSDCPLTTGADIDSVFDAMPPAPGVVLVPSRELSGTNIIGRTPPGAILTRFGRQSLMRHLESCEKARIPSRVVRLAGPAMDLDLMSDLADFVRVPGSTHTFNRLARLGIAQI